MSGSTTKTVLLQLNQQQIELLDRTMLLTGDQSREDLVRRALRDVAKRGAM